MDLNDLNDVHRVLINNAFNYYNRNSSVEPMKLHVYRDNNNYVHARITSKIDNQLVWSRAFKENNNNGKQTNKS